MKEKEVKPVALNEWINEDEARTLASADQSPPLVVLLKALKKKSDKIDHKLHTNPQRNDKDLKRDTVYQLGQTGMAEWILGLVQAAKIKAAGDSGK